MALRFSAYSVVDPTLPTPGAFVSFGLFGAVRQLRESGSGDPPPSWLALPHEHVTIRTFTYPTLDSSTISGLLYHSAQGESPYPEAVELYITWAIIAQTTTHSTVLLAFARKDNILRLAKEYLCHPRCRIVPAFAPLYNLFVTRYPTAPDKTYALLHLTPRTSFIVICRQRELLGVQNLSGFSLRNGATAISVDNEVDAICGRLAPILHRTLHSLETDNKIPPVDEIIISSSCIQTTTLTAPLADQLGRPIVEWPNCGVPSTHLTALGLAAMARQLHRFDLFEFTDQPHATAKPICTPLTALRYACHFLVVVLLFLSLQMILADRSRELGNDARQLNQELIALQPDVAASTTLYNENAVLLKQVAADRQSLSPDLAMALTRLAEITPPDIAVRNITIGATSGPATATSMPAAAPRRIIVSDSGNQPAATATHNTAPPVTIAGRASGALAFVRYCQALEGARLLTDVRCRTAETTSDGIFSFSLEGKL